MDSTRSKTAFALAWVLFWTLMVLVAVEDYRRDGGSAWWQPVLWETCSAPWWRASRASGHAWPPLRWPAFGIAALGWTLLVMWNAVSDEILARPVVALLRPAMYAMYALLAWSAMVAACGFAARHLGRDGPARRYLNEAIFPVYILHQTLIVTLAHTMQPLRIAAGVEAVLLVVLTLTLSFGIFEMVRRVRLLRPLFGLALPAGAAPAAPRPLDETAQDRRARTAG